MSVYLVTEYSTSDDQVELYWDRRFRYDVCTSVIGVFDSKDKALRYVEKMIDSHIRQCRDWNQDYSVHIPYNWEITGYQCFSRYIAERNMNCRTCYDVQERRVL